MFKRPRNGQKQLEIEVVVGEALAGRTEVLGARARRKHRAPESVNRGRDKCYVIGHDRSATKAEFKLGVAVHKTVTS